MLPHMYKNVLVIPECIDILINLMFLSYVLANFSLPTANTTVHNILFDSIALKAATVYSGFYFRCVTDLFSISLFFLFLLFFFVVLFCFLCVYLLYGVCLI